MDDGPGLPEGIGPHEFRELELKLSGKKPLAMLSIKIEGISSSRKTILNLMFGPEHSLNEKRYIKNSTIPTGQDSSTTACHRRCGELKGCMPLAMAIHCGERKATDEGELETGRLLGYSKEQVQVFCAGDRLSG